MRQDQAQDVTLVSGTGDRRENCLENRGEIMEASMLQEEGRSESRKGREKEKWNNKLSSHEHTCNLTKEIYRITNVAYTGI